MWHAQQSQNTKSFYTHIKLLKHDLSNLKETVKLKETGLYPITDR